MYRLHSFLYICLLAVTSLIVRAQPPESLRIVPADERTELYLPVDGFEINVKVGDRVYGGETVMATVKE